MRLLSRVVTGAVAALLLAGPAGADPTPIFGPDSLFGWQFVGDARISSDGQRIVYALATTDAEKDDYSVSLWLAEGKAAPRALTAGPSDRAPRWSPDGTQVAFVSNRNGKPQIHMLDLRGGEAWQVTTDDSGVQGFAWSPDGKRIAFTSRTALAGEAGYEAVAADKHKSKEEKEKERGPKPFVTEQLQYRADGVPGYRSPRRTHIWVVAADRGPGQTAQRVTRGDYNDGEPAWSVDGKLIYFSAIRGADADYSEDSEIYAVPADGSAEPRALTQRRGADGNPRPSPDGRWIAYTGYDEVSPARNREPTNLYIMRTDGSQSRQLATDLDRNVGEVAMNDILSPRATGDFLTWTPDSRRVLFLSSDHGQTHLYSAPTASGDFTALTRFQQGNLSEFSIDRKGRIATVFSAPTQPGEVFAFDLAQAGDERWQGITTHHAAMRAQTQFAPYEEIRYDSFDGRRIQGWLIKPPGFDAQRRYPLILYVHGGPNFMYGTGFFHELQVLAQAGYCVLITNPRGSTGYGGAFTNIIQYRYPGDDFKDLMAAVDLVLERGFIDKKRLGIAGGSYGGVMTSWTVAHTDRFSAAVVERAVTNWHSFVGSADKNYYFVKHWFRDLPWRDTANYIERSPLSYVDHVKTPVLVIHNEQDYITTLDQGLQYYAALKMLKKPARLALFPNSGHGMSRDGPPSLRVQRLKLITAWFDEHLQQ